MIFRTRSACFLILRVYDRLLECKHVVRWLFTKPEIDSEPIHLHQIKKILSHIVPIMHAKAPLCIDILCESQVAMMAEEDTVFDIKVDGTSIKVFLHDAFLLAERQRELRKGYSTFTSSVILILMSSAVLFVDVCHFKVRQSFHLC